MTDYRLTDEDKERTEMLRRVSEKGLGALDLEQLRRLEKLVSKKDYTHSRKAQRSKKKLLSRINAAIYDSEESK